MSLSTDLPESRRRFITNVMATLGLIIGNKTSVLSQARLQQLSYLADMDGDGLVGQVDREIAETALYAQRGSGLLPDSQFDQRLDVFGRGVIDRETVEAVLEAIETFSGANAIGAQQRPATIAWHYGWYNTIARPAGWQTVRYKGGDYLSFDPLVEPTFNELKNEFGVTVDALSWIPKRDNKDNQDNYRSAYLKAPNLDTRNVCLLYESTIALPSSGERVDFQSPDVMATIREDFAEMARFMVEIRDDTPARIYELDGKPVVFIFGSHTWGNLPYVWGVAGLIGNIREIFRDIYGSYPFIVGEEMYLSSNGEFSTDRVLRTRNFDGVYVYHHASNLKRARYAVLQMSPSYIENQVNILRRTYAAVQPITNRYTGQPILVIPNLAPGFAKPAHPTLLLGRAGYADFMKLLKGIHETWWSTFTNNSNIRTPAYVVGSWNEEFEGHCVCPFEFNFSVPEVVQQGFDLSMPIKEVFGWNHYANRAIPL